MGLDEADAAVGDDEVDCDVFDHTGGYDDDSTVETVEIGVLLCVIALIHHHLEGLDTSLSLN